MDDPWANAWTGEPIVEDLQGKPALATKPSWGASETANTNGFHEEEVVAAPLWSSGGTKWNDHSTSSTLWQPEEDSWGGTPLTSLPVTKVVSLPPLDEPESEDSKENEEEEEEEGVEDIGWVPQAVHSPVTATSQPTSPLTAVTDHVHNIVTPPKSHSEQDVEEPPETADGFGDFAQFQDSAESPGANHDESWNAFDTAGAGDSVWGSGKVGEGQEGSKDEWEVAREMKMKRDRAVPPEVLTHIMEQYREMVQELWPGEEPQSLSGTAVPPPKESLEDNDDLKALMEKIIPPGSSYPPIAFGKTHIAKSMVNSIKLSKNLPIVRLSPMSQLLSGTGNSAWELSVKNKVDVIVDDIPAGWRTVQQSAADEAKAPEPERKSGFFASLWGRRQPSVASLPETKKAAEASAASGSRTQSPSSSQFNPEVRSVASRVASPAPSTASAQPPASIASIPQSPPANAAQSSRPSTPAATSGSAGGIQSPSSPKPPVAAEQPQPTAEQPAPSTVSRFFSRFSRQRTRTSSETSLTRQSVALSAEDMDFLSEIPSAADGIDDDPLDALNNFVSKPPEKLPPPLAPPPLAPPPLAPPPRPSSRPTVKPAIPSVPPKVQPQAQSSVFNDLNSLFGDAPLPESPANATSQDSLFQSAMASAVKGTPLHKLSTAGPSNRPLISSPLSGSTASPANTPLEAFSRPSSSALPPLLPPPRVPSIPPPLNSTLPIISPPPPSISTVPAQPSNAFDDDDDFDDFQSFPAGPLNVPSTPFHLQASPLTDMGFDSPSQQGLFPREEISLDNAFNEDSFGSFADVASPSIPLPSPPPPRPPSKTLSPPPSGYPSPSPPPPPQPTPVRASTVGTHVRKPSQADHQHTQSLLDRAAARQGRWPAPASPLPAPLAPPGRSGGESNGFFASLQDQQAPSSSSSSSGLGPLFEASTQLTPKSGVSLFQDAPTSAVQSSASSAQSVFKIAPPPSTTFKLAPPPSFAPLAKPPPPPSTSSRMSPPPQSMTPISFGSRLSPPPPPSMTPIAISSVPSSPPRQISPIPSTLSPAFRAMTPPIRPASSSSMTVSSIAPSKAGVLSAQDLSFFEGL